jgi:hypothetical protein
VTDRATRVSSGAGGPSGPPGPDAGWLGGRRWSGLGALAVFAVVLLAAAVRLSGGFGAASSEAGPTGTPTDTRTDTRTGAPTGAGPSAASPAASGAAPPTAAASLDTRIPTSAPSGVNWQVWNGIALPGSPAAGPARITGQAAAGFAHGPTGALIAAVQGTARCAAATDPGWREVLATMVAPGPGLDARIAWRSRVAHPQPPPAGTFAQVAGFQFLSWTPSDAVLHLVFRDPTGGLSVTAVHLVWLNQDWKLVLAADGSDGPSQQQVESLAGFVAWGGV